MTVTPTTSTTAAAAASASAAGNPLVTLSNNFNDFLSLLTTQMQNQDPTTPMDTNTFTTELVQFTGVEQQISTNANLTQLIQATQGTEVIQATGIEGKSVNVTSSNLALQSGTAAMSFNTTTAQPVTIQITDSSGAVVKTASLTSTAGTNSWSWNGVTDSGAQEPDGSYGVTVNATNAAGATTPVPFSVAGKVTGVANTGGSVNVDLGAVSVPFNSIQSVGN